MSNKTLDNLLIVILIVVSASTAVLTDFKERIGPEFASLCARSYNHVDTWITNDGENIRELVAEYVDGGLTSGSVQNIADLNKGRLFVEERELEFPFYAYYKRLYFYFKDTKDKTQTYYFCKHMQDYFSQIRAQLESLKNHCETKAITDDDKALLRRINMKEINCDVNLYLDNANNYCGWYKRTFGSSMV